MMQPSTSSMHLNPSDDGHSGEKSLQDHIKDIKLKNTTMQTVINKIESIITDKEKQRNFKLNNDFEREKSYILQQQAEVKSAIDSISKNNLNERIINYIKEEKNLQQDLYNKYYTLNGEVVSKINKIKEGLPDLNAKIKRKEEKLKLINQENLRLMERISELERRDKVDQSGEFKGGNLGNINESSIEDKNKQSIMEDNTALENTINVNNKTMLSKFKYSEYGKENSSILNITEVVGEDEGMREKFEKINKLKAKLKQLKKENVFYNSQMSDINTNIFILTKLFTEGCHEISKELLKIHEIQLDKIVTKHSYGNSLYFELIKDRSIANINGSYNLGDMRLPIINANITKKYNYPVIEKADPTTFIYNVVKEMLQEHHNLNKNINIKKKKFDWDEFKTFSAYQVYTLLSLNKEAMKKLEVKLFPRKFQKIPSMSLSRINEDDDKYEEHEEE